MIAQQAEDHQHPRQRVYREEKEQPGYPSACPQPEGCYHPSDASYYVSTEQAYEELVVVSAYCVSDEWAVRTLHQ